MKVHFISIGGSVMHQLAVALKHKGYQVSGSDDEIFEPSRTVLEAEGLLPAKMGWDDALITPDLDAVILGMHAKQDNPEIARAKEMGLSIYSFPEYIYQESHDKIRVVVGGSHGKTTTTSMIMHVLKNAQKSFDYMVGARLAGFERSVQVSDAPFIICEGDEYPASIIEKRPKFHFLYPQVAIITGIAWDHINVFPTFENYLEQFSIFIEKIVAGGILIYNETDPVLKKLIEENHRGDIRYQPYNIPAHEISNGKTVITIEGISTQLEVFGNHNLLNLQAAFFACKELGLKTEEFIKAIGSFTGASKRLEKLSENLQTIVYRDFAHAPSKVKATMEAVKQQYPDRKLIVALELHTYSSLSEGFLHEYKGALDAADEAAVFYSNHALQLKKMPELQPEMISKGFGNNSIAVINDKEILKEWLGKHDYTNANLLLMSSGNYDGLDILKLADSIVKQ